MSPLMQVNIKMEEMGKVQDVNKKIKLSGKEGKIGRGYDGYDARLKKTKRHNSMISEETMAVKEGLKMVMWSVNMRDYTKADMLDNLISLGVTTAATTKQRQIGTFCTGCKAQHSTMPLNRTHTSPKHVRQRITTIQLRRYGQTSPCDWIPRSEAHRSGCWRMLRAPQSVK